VHDSDGDAVAARLTDLRVEREVLAIEIVIDELQQRTVR